VTFFANAVGGGVPDGQIWGNAGLSRDPAHWDYVRLFNYSDKDLVTNLIDVVDGGGIIDIKVDVIHGPTNTPGKTFRSTRTIVLARAGCDLRVRSRSHLPAPRSRSAPAAGHGGRQRHHPGWPDREPDRFHRHREPRGNIRIDTDSDVELIRTSERIRRTGSIGQQGRAGRSRWNWSSSRTRPGPPMTSSQQSMQASMWC
jgi:hypothetical protein